METLTNVLRLRAKGFNRPRGDTKGSIMTTQLPTNGMNEITWGRSGPVVTSARPFRPDKCSVLFFSRGRGHGHAIPDMAIADELHTLDSAIDIRFVSYGTGATTLLENHRQVIDLQMHDTNLMWSTVVRAGRVIAKMKPDIVVSHEEFAALPVAKIFNIPTVFITEWFTYAATASMQALLYADDILFAEQKGLFEEPHYLKDRIHYVGSVLRRFSWTKSDRHRARHELGLPLDGTVILVAPGGWATEEREPFAEMILSAFEAIAADRKLLIWLAGNDYEALLKRCSGRTNVMLKAYDWQIDRLMVASDLAITKANRITVKELAALGIPSISISHGGNPIDDLIIGQISNNTSLTVRELDRDLLARQIMKSLRRAMNIGMHSPSVDSNSSGAHLAAKTLASIIQKIGKEKKFSDSCSG